MATVRGGHATTPAPKFVAPKIPKGTPIVNPWHVPNAAGQSITTNHPAAPAAAGTPATPGTPGTPGTPAVPGQTMGDIDWTSVLKLDPAYVAAVSGADAQIANLNEAFDGATNPFSTVKQLQLQLGQNLRTNANNHNAHGTLFSGGTAQGAINTDRDNQKERYDAHQHLLDQIATQQGVKSTALADATGRVLGNPALYGLNTTGTDAVPATPGTPGTPATPATPAGPTSTIPAGTALPVNDTGGAKGAAAARSKTPAPKGNHGVMI